MIQVFLLAFITDQRTQIRDVENKQWNNGGFTSQKFQIMHTRCSQVARRRCFKIQRPVSVWKGFLLKGYGKSRVSRVRPSAYTNTSAQNPGGARTAKIRLPGLSVPFPEVLFSEKRSPLFMIRIFTAVTSIVCNFLVFEPKGMTMSRPYCN